MATETQSAPAAPELKIFTRVASIPLVNDTFAAVHYSLISNPLTRSPYTTAQAISLSALRASEPLAVKLAPIIVRADGFAIKGLDAVESRYPYAFTIQSEDILKALKERSGRARDVANKAIDERVRTPAYSAAQGIDQRLAPVLDYLIARLGTEENSSETDSKYQYQRAYALSRELKDQILDYSNTQLHQLQSNSILVQRATETAKNITNLASSSVVAAGAKVNVLSDTMVSELQKIQAATAALPSNLQASFKPVQEGIANTISDLSNVIKSDLPVNEKFNKFRLTVQDHVTPVLETAALRLQAVQDGLRSLTVRVGATGEDGIPQGTEKSNGDSR